MFFSKIMLAALAVSSSAAAENGTFRGLSSSVADLPSSTAPTTPTSGRPTNSTVHDPSPKATIFFRAEPNISSHPSSFPSLRTSNSLRSNISGQPSSFPSLRPSHSFQPTYLCDDRNACTADSYNDTLGACVHEVINCDDGNPDTIDTCDPSSGCKFLSTYNLGSTGVDPTSIVSKDSYFYEDAPTLTTAQVANVIDWIKSKVTEIRIPFCWKQTYGRGVGKPISACHSNKEKIGALCYNKCPPGFSRQGTFDCQQECLPGWRDDGLFCRLPEYGRGAGYPWKFGDPLNDHGMYRRCEHDWGKGNCEKYGAVVYPKCRPGYHNAGCCICRPHTPNCAALGYESPGIGLSCPVKIIGGDPTPLVCRSGLEEDAALCYTPCRTGFKGIGPVCWQVCDTGETNCGAACAKDQVACGTTILNEVIAPLVIAANVATFGLAAAPDAALEAGLNAVKIGDKAVMASTTAGKAMIWLVSKLQTIQPEKLDKGASLYKRILNVALGSSSKRLEFSARVSNQAYTAAANYKSIFAANFVQMTSPEIASTLDEKLSPVDASHVKHVWAMIQFKEMAQTEKWQIAGTVLDVASLVDITGVTDLVAAYAKPKCKDVVPFPDLANLSPTPTSSVTLPPPTPTQSLLFSTPSPTANFSLPPPSPMPSLPKTASFTNAPSQIPTLAETQVPTSSSRAPISMAPFPRTEPNGTSTRSAPSSVHGPDTCWMPQHSENNTCQKDVKAIDMIGRTGFDGNPFIIVDRSSTEVTFQIQKQWNSTGPVYLQYFDPVVRQYTCVNACNKGNQFEVVARCMKSVPISIVEIWVETDELLDNANISSCCPLTTTTSGSLQSKHYFEGTYELRCDSLCDG